MFFFIVLLHQADPILLLKTVIAIRRRVSEVSPVVLSSYHACLFPPFPLGLYLETCTCCQALVGGRGPRSVAVGSLGCRCQSAALRLLLDGDKLMSGSQSGERAHVAIVAASGKKVACPMCVLTCGLAQYS